MANFFDQFDEQPQALPQSQPQQAANFFDQFDEMEGPNQVQAARDGLQSSAAFGLAMADFAGRALKGQLTPQEESSVARERGYQAGLRSNAWRAAGVGLQNGVTFGLADETVGLNQASGLPAGPWTILSAPVGMVRLGLDKIGLGSGEATKNYNEAKDYARGWQEGAKEANPIAYYGSEIAGGIGTGVGAARAGVTMARVLPKAFATANPVKAGIAVGAGDGAAFGAAYGAGNATEGNRLSGAGTGALIGGGLGGGIGAATPTIAAGAGRAYDATMRGLGLRSASPAAEAVQRLSVNLPAAVATDNMAVQRAAATLKNVPGGGDPLVKSTRNAIQQLGEAADNIAAGYGGTSPDRAGQAAREAIETGWVGRTKERTNSLYNQVDQLVDSSVMTPLESTRRAVAEILGEQQAARITDPGKAVSFVADAISDRAGLSYQGIKNLRTRVGEMLENPQALASSGVSQRELKRVYSALSDDLTNAARNSGGERALQAHNRANTYSRLAAERRSSLKSIVKAESDEGVYNSLLRAASDGGKANAALIHQARKAIGPDSWHEVAGTIVSRMGRDVEGNFSPQRFLSDYNKMSLEGKLALFSTNGKGDLARSLNDLAIASSKFKELQQFANPSGTAQGLLGGAVGGGLIAEPMTAISAVLGARATSMLLSRPTAVKATATFLERLAAAAARPNASQAMTQAYLRKNAEVYANELNKELGINIDPTRLLSGFGQRPAHTDNDQQQPPSWGR